MVLVFGLYSGLAKRAVNRKWHFF